MTFEDILTHFTIKSRHGDKVQCVCPAHDDKQASLTISRGKKGALLYCHAGCQLDSILQAAGLSKVDLFYDVVPKKSNWKSYIESREGKRIEAVYHYYSIAGGYAFTKIRLEGKKILYGRLADDRFTYGLGHDTSRKSFKAIYGSSLTEIHKAIADGRPIFIPEGEKDVDTLISKGYTAFAYGGVNDWQSDFAEVVTGASVFILADNDRAGRQVANRIMNDIQTVVKSARIIVPTPDVPKADITDYFEQGHTKEEFEQLLIEDKTMIRAKKSVSDVQALLQYKVEYDKDGNPKKTKLMQTVKNFEIVLENDSRFAGRIKFDEFANQTYLVGQTPWSDSTYRAWNSADDSALFSLIQADYGLTNRNDFFDSLKIVTHKNRFHPVKDIFDSLEYDGKPHIRALLPDYLGTEDSEYNYQVMRLFMLGVVSRIYKPGTKFDYCPILQGRQGLGKSTFLRALALDDNWFNDSLDSLDSDKAAQSLMGTLIVELAELKSLARTGGGVDSVKRFLSATQDKYRIPYERRADVYPRQCCFCGTTNRLDFLTDETGNRRFLIVQTGVHKPTKDLFSATTMNDIKAAWSEAVYIYKNENFRLVLPDDCTEQARTLQEQALVDDGKIGLITDYLANKNRTCALEVWSECLGETGRPQKWQSSEINNLIANIPGWERLKSPTQFGRYGCQRGFVRQNTTNYAGNYIPLSKKDDERTPFD